MGSYIGILNPPPEASGFDKIRDHDGTASGSEIVANYNRPEILCELPTVVATVDFFAKSTGAGAGAYSLLDLCTGSGTSLLTQKAVLTAQGVDVRGDTLPASANSVNHTRAVINESLFPLDPGQTIYWKNTIDDGAVFSTKPYGVGMVFSKYGVKD